MARKTKAEALATRESILDAAEQVFEAEGIPTATLERIGAAAGVTRGAIYWHFEDKEDLLNAIVERAQFPFDDLVQAGQRADSGDALAELRETGERSLRRLARDSHYQRICRILLHGSVRCGKHNLFITQEDRVRKGLTEATQILFEKARRQGTLRASLSPETATWAYATYMRGIHTMWLMQQDALDLESEGARLLDIFFSGVRADGGGAAS